MAQPACPPQCHTQEPVPQVSVIIANYNGAAYLPACLSALLRTSPGAEVIVIDNASTDGSLALLAGWADQVRTVALPDNTGYGAANNLGSAIAEAPYLVFLNPDTETEDGWLEPLIDALASDRQCGLVTPKIVKLQAADTINTCGLDVHISGLTLCRGLNQVRGRFQRTERTTSISGAACAVRKDLFLDLGGFDQSFFLYMEDTDLSWRVQEAGYTCKVVADSVVRHAYSLRMGPRKVFYQERNRYLMLLKSLHWGTLAALLPVLLLAEVVTWGFVLWQQPRNWRSKVDAYLWIARHWSCILGSRRAVQARRRSADRQLLARCTHRLAFDQVGQLRRHAAGEPGV